MAQIVEIGLFDQYFLFLGQIADRFAQLRRFLLQGQNIGLIRFLVWPPLQVFGFRTSLFSQRVNLAITRYRKNPRRSTCAGRIEKMRLLPKSGHHVLSAFLGKGLIRPGLHQETFHPWSKVIEQARKGLPVLVFPDALDTGDPIVVFRRLFFVTSFGLGPCRWLSRYLTRAAGRGEAMSKVSCSTSCNIPYLRDTTSRGAHQAELFSKSSDYGSAA